jgi:hypothetical protein
MNAANLPACAYLHTLVALAATPAPVAALMPDFALSSALRVTVGE